MKTIVPSSHTIGRRYYQENFQDGLTICRVDEAPDTFTIFTCSPMWLEITKMKLNEYLDEIQSGHAYGPINAGTILFTLSMQLQLEISD